LPVQGNGHDPADLSQSLQLVLSGQFPMMMPRTHAAFIDYVIFSPAYFMPAMPGLAAAVAVSRLWDFDEHTAFHLNLEQRAFFYNAISERRPLPAQNSERSLHPPRLSKARHY
jgi:hypothetical protein